MRPHKERQLRGRGINTIDQLEKIPLEELAVIPSWKKEARESVEVIVQAYLKLQVKKGGLDQITELQLVCEIREILERCYKEREYKKRTLKEIFEELQSKSGKEDGVMFGDE